MELSPSNFILFRKTLTFKSWKRNLWLTNTVLKKIKNANLENMFTFLNSVTLFWKTRTILFHLINPSPAKLCTVPAAISVPNWWKEKARDAKARASQPVILQKSMHSECHLLQHTKMPVLVLPTAKEHMRNTAGLPNFFKSLGCIGPHARTIEK